MINCRAEANNNVFGIEGGTRITEVSQSTASFFHNADSPKDSFIEVNRPNGDIYSSTKVIKDATNSKYGSVTKLTQEKPANTTKRIIIQQLPKLVIPEPSNKVRIRRQKSSLLEYQQQKSPDVLLAGNIKSYTNNHTPESRGEVNWLVYQDRAENESYRDSYRMEKNGFNNVGRWEWNARRYSQNHYEDMTRGQESPPLVKTKAFANGPEPQEVHRVRLLTQIINNEKLASKQGLASSLRFPRCVTIDNQMTTTGDSEIQDQYLYTERTAHISAFPYLVEETIKLENKFGASGKRSVSPVPVHQRNVKHYYDFQENNGKMSFRNSLVKINPVSKLDGESYMPVDIMVERENFTFNQYNNQNIKSETERRHKRTSSMEVKLSTLPLEESKLKRPEVQLSQVPRGLSDTNNRKLIQLEEATINMLKNNMKNHITTKLRPKFKGQEAILNKLFSRHQKNKK